MEKLKSTQPTRPVGLLTYAMVLLLVSACDQTKGTRQATEADEKHQLAQANPAPAHPVPRPQSIQETTSKAEKGANQRKEVEGYDVPELNEKELALKLADLCERAQGKPMLLEFSAPWCSDCRRLHQMKQIPPLKQELEKWNQVTINIGNFDHHEALLEHFKIKAIANWQIVQAPNCTLAATSWQTISHRTLEPTGKDRKVTPQILTHWLSNFH